MLSLNIRSITRNLEEFLVDFALDCHLPDFVSFCETRLTVELNALYEIPNYCLFSNPRNTSGGGVAMYINREHSTVLLNDINYMSPDFESIFVSVAVRGKKYICGCVYRPPAGDMQVFLHKLSDVLKII